MRLFIAALAVLSVTATSALACTPADVEARQGALIAAVQNLMATDPARAQQLVAQMQEEMNKVATEEDEAAVCVLMDRLTAEAQS